MSINVEVEFAKDTVLSSAFRAFEHSGGISEIGLGNNGENSLHRRDISSFLQLSVRKTLKRLCLAPLLLFVTGCGYFQQISSPTYRSHPDSVYFRPGSLWKDTEVGEIKGQMRLQWVAADRFLYVPDERDPLTFIRKQGGQTIELIVMNQPFYTDGGSIPRIVRFSSDFSPWKFAPAYIIHDWLFEMNHCDIPGKERYDHVIAARIMAEVVKTQMVASKQKDAVLLYDLYGAVWSHFAAEAWEAGPCRCDLVAADPDACKKARAQKARIHE